MLNWYYVVFPIFVSHVVFSEETINHGAIECYYPLWSIVKDSYQNFLNFTTNDETSILVYQWNNLVFTNTNIQDGEQIYPCLETDGDCEYGTFDIVYNEGISESLEKELNATIFQKHLNPGDKTSYRLLNNGRYCIYYYDFNNENTGEIFPQASQGDKLQTLEVTHYFTSKGLEMEQDGLLVADITALIFELILIAALRGNLRKFGIDGDSINQIPFKFMINLLFLEVISNSIEISILGFIHLISSEDSHSILNFNQFLKVIVDYFKAFTLYHFIALNKAVLVPANWEIKEILLNHRFFFIFSILKAFIEIRMLYEITMNIYGYDLFQFLNGDVILLISAIMCVLYYYKSQRTELSLRDSFKEYSCCLRYSRVIILPSFLIYSTFMWFGGFLLEGIITAIVSIRLVQSPIDPQSLLKNIEFSGHYTLYLLLYMVQSFYRFTLPLMITLMSYIWRGVLVSEPESKKINQSTT